MLITCPQCATAYEVKPASLGEAGRSVRCARCKTVWFAIAPAPVRAPALAETGFETIGFDAAWSAPAAEPDLPATFDQPPTMASAEDTEASAAIEWSAPPIEASDAPPLVPMVDDITQPPAAAEPDTAEDVETVAARHAQLARDAGRRHGLRRPGMPVVILALGVLVAALFAWRAEVVRLVPQTAGLYARLGLPVNLRGLAFQDVRISGETHEGVPVLVVQGTIANVAGRAVEVPRLRFALRNASGVEVYAWTALPGHSVLGEGETLPFRSRLASPPADTGDVQVRFFNRRDIEAGR